MNRREILAAITQKEIQLKNLENKVDVSCVCSDLYNKIVIEKAVLKKDLDSLDSKMSFLDGIKKIMPRKKRLICDYFR